MARAPRQPGLFEADASPPANGGPLRALSAIPLAGIRPASRLWLGLYFPALPLTALTGKSGRPRAVLSTAARQARILSCDQVAARHGVHAGLSASAALALLPELELLPRDRQREQYLLSGLADLAMDFTSAVSLASSDTLLLEIGGSLKLFGTVDRLRTLVLEALRTRSPEISAAVAPTARAARWLAFARTDALVTDRALLGGQLGKLRLSSLPWPTAWRQRLQEMGVETLADCVRLPREGVARRFGAGLLEELDQAYGRCPEALAWYRSKQQFCDRVELEQESRDTRQLAAALDILIERLARELQLRQRGVRRIWVHCEHRDQVATQLRLGLLQATAEPTRLRELSRVQLAAIALPAGVTAVSIQADLDTALALQSVDWLENGGDAAENALAFVERLRARLGENSVHGLQTCAEHRPELAWQAVCDLDIATDHQAASLLTTGQRPLWMLPVPLKLTELQRQPVFQGGLEISRGPERIETGWWDGGDIRRDYYVAWNHRGMQLWIYRDLRTTHWYLHGLFG